MKKIFLFALIALSQIACNINRLVDELITTREQAIFAIDEAIYSLDNGIAGVKTTLADLDTKLSTQIQDGLVYNVPYIINTLIGETVPATLCTIDFTASRAVFYLNLMKAELLTGQRPGPPRPVSCQSSVDKIDLNAPLATRNVIELSGYDFLPNRDSFLAYFIPSSGQPLAITKQKINFQSNYELTINISGFSDDIIGKYAYFTLKFANSEFFSIPIVPKAKPIPQVTTVYIAPQALSYLPPHTNGDREFDGNGPNIYVEGRLLYNYRQAYVQIWMSAIETRGDYTTAKGWCPNHYFYTAPAGWHIKRIDGQTVFPSLVRYTDNDTQEDIFNTTLGQVKIKGDGNGNDAGIHTGILSFNFSYKIPIVIEQD